MGSGILPCRVAEPYPTRFFDGSAKATIMPKPLSSGTFVSGPGRLMKACSFLMAAALLTGCQQNGTAKANKSPKVVIAYPVTGQVVDFRDFTGRFEAVKSVDIRSRV